MTKRQCLEVMAYLAAAISKPPLSDRAGDIYFDLLGDLPLDVFHTAAKRVILDHVWATFPSIAELRQAATDIIHAQAKQIDAAKAWELAWQAVRSIDLEITGPYKAIGHRDNGESFIETYPSQAASVLAKLPSVVVQAMNAFGLAALCYGKEPVTIVRSQFMVIFQKAQDSRDQLALMPPALAKEIESRATLPPSAARAIEQIGSEF